MHPILFSIKGINFYSYGFFVSMAFLTTYAMLLYLFKIRKIKTNFLFEKLFLIFLSGIIGARISYFVVYFNEITHWYDLFKIWEGGMISFGGIVFGFLAFLFLFKKNIWLVLDSSIVAFLAGATVWRMGCFMAGDHPGIFSTAWYAINYEVPAILFELILSSVGFIISYYLFRKNIFKNGYLFFIFWSWYGLERIFVDSFRADPLYFSLRGGQIAGIMMIFTGLIGLIILITKYKNKEKNAKIRTIFYR